MQIIGIKLSSGEEIIGKIKYANSTSQGLTAQEVFEGKPVVDDGKLPDSVILEDVRQIHLQQVGPQQMGLGLAPWALGNQEASFQINIKQHALTVYTPSPEIEQAYIQQTSKIAIASAGSMPGALNTGRKL
jgi:hypothetical protein